MVGTEMLLFMKFLIVQYHEGDWVKAEPFDGKCTNNNLIFTYNGICQKIVLAE